MTDTSDRPGIRKLVHTLCNLEWVGPKRKVKGTVSICPQNRCPWRRDNGVGYTCGAGGCIMEVPDDKRNA